MTELLSVDRMAHLWVDLMVQLMDSLLADLMVLEMVDMTASL